MYLVIQGQKVQISSVPYPVANIAVCKFQHPVSLNDCVEYYLLLTHDYHLHSVMCVSPELASLQLIMALLSYQLKEVVCLHRVPCLLSPDVLPPRQRFFWYAIPEKQSSPVHRFCDRAYYLVGNGISHRSYATTCISLSQMFTQCIQRLSVYIRSLSTHDTSAASGAM